MSSCLYPQVLAHGTYGLLHGFVRRKGFASQFTCSFHLTSLRVQPSRCKRCLSNRRMLCAISAALCVKVAGLAWWVPAVSQVEARQRVILNRPGGTLRALGRAVPSLHCCLLVPKPHLTAGVVSEIVLCSPVTKFHSYMTPVSLKYFSAYQPTGQNISSHRKLCGYTAAEGLQMCTHCFKAPLLTC